MKQADLFKPEEPRRCGNCVVLMQLCDHPGVGACSRHGDRRFDAEPCGDWFGLDQARAPLYGVSKRTKK